MPSSMHNPAGLLSLEGMGFLLFCLAGAVALLAYARKELRETLRRRATLLDDAAGLLDNPRVTISRDGFPALSGTWRGHAIGMELIADSLVPRRLPQLWLKSTLIAQHPSPRPSIGVLARPAGTEFYSRVQGLPDTIVPTFPLDFPFLMRGRDATDAQVRRAGGPLRALFSDPQVKEAVITPRGAGLVRQIAEGERGAHILYRQMRFPVEQVPVELARKALAELQMLNSALETRPADAEVS
ncbi:MAG: hypothetical protein JNL61_08325 [Rhizobiaceae bacterium]|nr:hypothetical protein [Rhizobiaceae bacterium]